MAELSIKRTRLKAGFYAEGENRTRLSREVNHALSCDICFSVPEPLAHENKLKPDAILPFMLPE